MPSSHLFLDREQRVIKETVGNWWVTKKKLNISIPKTEYIYSKASLKKLS
jgi:hypothetical protein